MEFFHDARFASIVSDTSNVSLRSRREGEQSVGTGPGTRAVSAARAGAEPGSAQDDGTRSVIVANVAGYGLLAIGLAIWIFSA